MIVDTRWMYIIHLSSGILLCMRPANERWRYNVTSSLIGWAHTWRHQDLTPYGMSRPQWVNSSPPGQNGCHFADNFFNAFSWMKMYQFRLRFHWNLFLRLKFTIFQQWFRWWLGADQATSHYLNQWWLASWCINASLGLNELMYVYQDVINLNPDWFLKASMKQISVELDIYPSWPESSWVWSGECC